MHETRVKNSPASQTLHPHILAGPFTKIKFPISELSQDLDAGPIEAEDEDTGESVAIDAIRTIGKLAGKVATQAQLAKFKAELAKLGVSLVENADASLQAMKAGAMFVAEKGKIIPKVKGAGAIDNPGPTVYLRAGATEYEIFHELAHVKQWYSDPKGYASLSVYEKELFVYNEVMANKSMFSAAELNDARIQLAKYGPLP